MAAPKCRGALSWRVPAQWEEPRPEGRRSQSRAPLCRAQPAVPFVVPEERWERDEVTCAGTKSVGATAGRRATTIRARNDPRCPANDGLNIRTGIMAATLGRLGPRGNK